MLMHRQTVPGRAPVDPIAAGVGHAAIRGAVIGFFVVLTIVGGIVFLTGAGLGIALAVGAYAGIWGGPGWGGMMAAQIYADRVGDGSQNESGADR